MAELNLEEKPVKLYTIKKLIRDSFSVIKRDSRVPLEIALLSIVVYSVFGFFIKWSTSKPQINFFSFHNISLTLLSGLIGLIFIIAQICAINNLSENREVALGESLKASFEKYFPCLWVSILLTVVIFGGCVLLIIPGIIFGIWFLFSTYALILEDKRGAAALKRSKQLVQKNGWYVFVIGSAMHIIFFAPAYFLTGIIWAILHLTVKTPLTHEFFTTLVAIFFPVISILATAANILLFKNLREVKGDAIVSVPYRL